MNDTNVPSSRAAPLLDQLVEQLQELSPQLRKAAQYVIDHPSHVGVSSIREIAEAADVKPNTLVRMARAVGFDGFDDFREPFRETLRTGRQSFPDRARWLQSIAKGGRHGALFGDMAESALENIERMFAGITAREVRAAADRIVAARRTYVVGVGVSYALAHNFAYLARMALSSVIAVPQEGSLPVDDIARAGREDVVLAMTFEPYRSEVVDAVHVAKEQGARTIVITDSRASPVALASHQAFVVPTETPQFFTSTIAAAALLETLMAFVVADADADVVASIDSFHQRRHRLGVYWRGEG